MCTPAPTSTCTLTSSWYWRRDNNNNNNNSLNKLNGVCLMAAGEYQGGLLSALDASKWLDYIKLILEGALKVRNDNTLITTPLVEIFTHRNRQNSLTCPHPHHDHHAGCAFDRGGALSGDIALLRRVGPHGAALVSGSNIPGPLLPYYDRVSGSHRERMAQLWYTQQQLQQHSSSSSSYPMC
jgi:hypothetical protein